MGAVPEEGGENGGPYGRALRTTVALEGDGSSIARARHLAADFLAEMQSEHEVPVSPRGTDLTRLVVSELVTNALKYAPGPILMSLAIVGGLVEIAVWDAEPAVPVARTPDAARVGQHGLEIVMAVARDFEVRQESVGKRITVHLALTDGTHGAPALGAPDS